MISYDDPRMRPLDRIDLWPGRMPCGDVSLLYGDGAVGKGRMVCDLIGRVTTGRPMPLCGQDTAAEPGSVIVVLPEDDPNEQVAHRLRAAGADLSRVYDLTRLEGGSRFKLSATPRHAGDLAHLRGVIDQLEAAGRNPRLVVIDPLAAVVGWGTIATNAGARQLVEPLQDMARETGVAVLVVAHTVKSGALQGSAGLPQALRTVWKVSRDKDNPAYRVLELAKANNLPETEPARYTVTEDESGAVRVIWQDLATVHEQRTSWRDRLAARRGTAAVTPDAAKLAGYRHPRSKFGTPAQCGDCPAGRLRPASPATPPPFPAAPFRVPAAVTYIAAVIRAQPGQEPQKRIIARGITDPDVARAMCEASPEAAALAAAGIPVRWEPGAKPGQWKAGTAALCFGIAAETPAARAV